jgi:NitT/TauT family transport system ATP-binding protein
METTTGTLLKLQHVSQIYGSGQRRFTAVEDVNLSLLEGEFVALLGPSGCGKSTLLRIITGLQPPSEGQVLYRDVPLRGVNPHASIVFQTFALFPWLSVFENVEVGLKARGVPPSIRTARAMDLIDRVGLDGFETAYPRELSGGMRQKVGFARAMAVEPELLCLDEPFSALDVLSAEALRGELMELWTSGRIPTRALLIVTHSIEEAVFMTDRIVVMEKGPGRVIKEVKVALPHPRRRKDPRVLELVDHVYATLAGQTQPEHVELGSEPGKPGRTRALPHVSINELTGLLEHLEQVSGRRSDIFRLAEELRVNSDQLLGLIDAAELLGLATIAQGDVTLTSLGEAYANASILERKEMFAARIQRLPVIRWLTAMLRAAENQRLGWNVVEAALELEFPSEEAKRQLDTAVRWGRYAEILAYEDNTEWIYLEPGGTTRQT